MMAISRQTDYAVRVVLHLSNRREDGLASIAEIAAARLLPVPFVRRVVSRLAEAGILRTVRGVSGGVALGRPASEISLFDVVSAVEESLCPSPCVDAPEGCPFGRRCPVRDVWTDVGRVLDDHLRSVRFSELADAPASRRQDGRGAPRAPRRKGRRAIST